MILDKEVSTPACILLAGAIALAAASCGHQPSSEPAGSAGSRASAGGSRIKVGATISTLAALVEAVGGEKVDVFSIVPVGVSPETYDPAPRDLVDVAQAKLIVENGAGLELWMEKLLRSVANSNARVLVLSDGMPVVGATSKGEPGNPHLWLDPTYAQAYVRKIADALREIDPANAAAYTANERREIARLAELDRWIRSHTRERFGPVRAVEPSQVFELHFEGIRASTRHKSGVAVRFPRIARWRTDKPAAEADTLDALRRLAT